LQEAFFVLGAKSMFLSSLLLAIITYLNAILHLLLVFGAPFGELVLGGKYKVIPKEKRFINCIFFFVFTFLGTVYLQFTQIIPSFLPNFLSKGIIILLTVFFAYGIIGNLKFTSSKKERNVMTPVCIVSFVLSVLLLLF
jgi:hypothetical protein